MEPRRCLLVLISLFSFSVAAEDFADKPKNVIMMIADGWGYTHLDALHCYKDGTCLRTIYKDFSQLAMSTYSLNRKEYDSERAWADFEYVLQNPTDSSAAATALSTGVLTDNGKVGVDHEGGVLYHIIERAESIGKSTGIVTSVRLSCGTPAGFVAHVMQRNDYVDIGRYMILESGLEVIMGAGHPLYDNEGRVVPENELTPEHFMYVGGKEVWESVLAGTAGNNEARNKKAWTLLESREEFQALAASAEPPECVLGIPQVAETLQQRRSGNAEAVPYEVPLIQSVPTLSEMSLAALNVLDRNDTGFFLMIEGGAIDWASHSNQSGRVIEELMDFESAIESVVAWVENNSSWSDTLLIVTGDHECGYLTGPGSNPTWEPIVNNGKGNMPGMEWHSKGHTNSLIPLYFRGVGADTIMSLAHDTDIVRGQYIANSEVGKTLHDLWK